MKSYTANKLKKPTEIYREALKNPVTIEHRHHGEFVLIDSEAYIKMIDRLAELEACLDE